MTALQILICAFFSITIPIFADCYDCDVESMSSNCKLTNETMDFNAKFNATSQCILTNLKEACSDCLSPYQTLNTFYDGIREVKGDKFCFDTQDKVKLTKARHVRPNRLFILIFSPSRSR